MGSQDFARLRVGIGEPSRQGAARDHVLTRFTAGESRVLDAALEGAADAVEDWARQGAAYAANRWNSWAADIDAAPAAGARAETGPPDRGDEPQPDEHGIVRRSTGWRRLLDRG
jgi:PTH1 family peptidyl-tRNA hydrolase